MSLLYLRCKNLLEARQCRKTIRYDKSPNFYGICYCISTNVKGVDYSTYAEEWLCLEDGEIKYDSI